MLKMSFIPYPSWKLEFCCRKNYRFQLGRGLAPIGKLKFGLNSLISGAIFSYHVDI